MAFDADQNLDGLGLLAGGDGQVFYLRWQDEPAQLPSFAPQPRRFGRGLGGFPNRQRTHADLDAPPPATVDQLEPMLRQSVRPLEPHLFDITTADQFRKALSAIITCIDSL
jgi:hypothetical protein